LKEQLPAQAPSQTKGVKGPTHVAAALIVLH